jgi:anaerobic magnesium-protoporphyrin IX monomethyl ester cyclase
VSETDCGGNISWRLCSHQLKTVACPGLAQNSSLLYNPAMKLLLTTLHSRYIHSSLALPCLAASCSGIIGLEIVIREQTINERPEKVLAALSGENADIIAFSCYIWNIEQTLKIAAELKLLHPGIYIILGGPEVSYGSHELMAGNPHIDAVVRGEGEGTLRRLMLLMTAASGCAVPDESVLEAGNLTFRSGDEIISAPVSLSMKELDSIPSPFSAGLADISKPLVYIETSRGCPFSCSFCLSSAEKGVRSFSMARIESDLAILMERGVETIKLVDRTFNYDPARADHIWRFILNNNRKSRFHFEIAADLLTDDNLAILKTVPPDTFRFEIGVQSTAAETLESVGRKSDLTRLFENVSRLKRETSITLHLDLVAGLPGEDFDGFRNSVERLLLLKPDHIQVEPLKMLKGTAIRKSAKESGYSFSPYPPYRILKSRWLSFEEICRIEEIGDAIEDIYNSGRYRATLAMLSDYGPLYPLFTAQRPERNGVRQLPQAFSALLEAAEDIFPLQSETIRDTLRFDYCMTGHPGRYLPSFLQPGGVESGRPAPSISNKEVASRLSLPSNIRFRTFTASFGRDYTVGDLPEGETETTFVYGNFDGGRKVLLLSGSVSG